MQFRERNEQLLKEREKQAQAQRQKAEEQLRQQAAARAQAQAQLAGQAAPAAAATPANPAPAAAATPVTSAPAAQPQVVATAKPQRQPQDTVFCPENDLTHPTWVTEINGRKVVRRVNHILFGYEGLSLDRVKSGLLLELGRDMSIISKSSTTRLVWLT